jgi:hypothetical protein
MFGIRTMAGKGAPADALRRFGQFAVRDVIGRRGKGFGLEATRPQKRPNAAQNRNKVLPALPVGLGPNFGKGIVHVRLLMKDSATTGTMDGIFTIAIREVR